MDGDSVPDCRRGKTSSSKAVCSKGAGSLQEVGMESGRGAVCYFVSTHFLAILLKWEKCGWNQKDLDLQLIY